MSLDTFIEPFHYAFMQRAFVAALAVGLLCSTMGTYVVLRKLSFIGDGIAHASFAGIVIAYLRGANFYIGAAIVAVVTALGIGFVSRRGRISLDTTIGVLFTGMFALGVYLMSQQRSYAVDLQSFLFGDILAVQPQDLWLILALSAVVAATVVVMFRGLLYTSFDPVVAQASGIAAPTLRVCVAGDAGADDRRRAAGGGHRPGGRAAGHARGRRVSAHVAVCADDDAGRRVRRGEHRRRTLPVVLRARVERRDHRAAGDDPVLRGDRREIRAPAHCTAIVNGTVYSL